MKKLLILFTFIIVSHFSYSQNHSVGASYGYVFGGGITKFAVFDGASSYEYKNGNQFSFDYSFNLPNKLKLISGLQFQQNWMRGQNSSSTPETRTWDFRVDNLNIPILANFSFSKYFFLEGGPVLNFQISEEESYGIDPQNGIGLSFGLGAKYDIGKFNVFIKSQNQIQTIIPFGGQNYHDRLITNSLTVGIFYKL
ncbi:MAG: hypothetical protein ACQETL_02020 [Bacteroidota bacterium]